MSRLTTPPVDGVLDRLYADAARHRPVRHRPVERPQGWEGGERETFLRARNAYMEVSRNTGAALYLLARTRGAQAVVEFGTSFGISTIHLAAAVADNGGGVVIGTEFEPGKVAAARGSIREAGLDDVVELREGEATATLAQGLPAAVDLLFLDGAKSMYAEVLALVEPHLAAGALVVADNATRSPEFLERVRGAPEYLSVGFVSEDLEVALRLA